MKFLDPLCYRHCESPLGRLRLAASHDGLAGAWFAEGQRGTPSAMRWVEAIDHPVLNSAAEQIHRYFTGGDGSFGLPLDMSGGTAFQQAVWREMLNIPFGQTTTYGELARRVGRPRAVRAVGAAVGANPLSIIVPCHRVVGADGSLTGYAGGLVRKTALLALESAA
jgi:methylated-DNA-[protein]-cysteine S-methyltransferase